MTKNKIPLEWSFFQYEGLFAPDTTLINCIKHEDFFIKWSLNILPLNIFRNIGYYSCEYWGGYKGRWYGFGLFSLYVWDKNDSV